MAGTDADLIREHLDVLYTFDHRGRITGSNQFTGGEVPRFHLARSSRETAWRFRADLHEDIGGQLQELAREEQPLTQPREPPRHEQAFIDVLRKSAPIESIWRGPAYAFTQPPDASPANIVHIDAHNADLLSAHLDDWLIDVPHRRPFVAAIEDGDAVAVCASVRISRTAHEAGVATAPAFRKRGHAVRAVSAWARAVIAMRAIPLYSTSWDNIASQRVARRLGLKFIGYDFHVR